MSGTELQQLKQALQILSDYLGWRRVLSSLLDSLCPESKEAQTAGAKDELRGMERLKALEGF